MVLVSLLFHCKVIINVCSSHPQPMLEQIHAAANKVVVNCKDVGDLRKGPQDRNILLHCPSLQELLLKLGFSKNTVGAI